MPKSDLKVELSYLIANILRQEILENRITEGTHLNESALAVRFGVSRGPVREALSTLAHEGFATVLPTGRTIANRFSSTDMHYYYDIRIFIESESVKKILSEPDTPEYTEWISQLEELLASAQVLLDRNDESSFTRLDSEFHLAILKRANVKAHLLLWDILNNMNLSIMEVNRKYILHKKLHNLNVTFAFHDRILNGLKRRDLDYTLSNLQTHLRNGAVVYSEIIDTINSMDKEQIEGIFPSRLDDKL